MKAKKQLKTLSFVPVYHRRVSQGAYTRLQLKATKGLSMETVAEVKAEQQAILSEGFIVGEFDLERPFCDSKVESLSEIMEERCDW